jgi:hypothetical protein
MEREFDNRYYRRKGIIDILYFDRCYKKRIDCDYKYLMLNFGSYIDFEPTINANMIDFNIVDSTYKFDTNFNIG